MTNKLGAYIMSLGLVLAISGCLRENMDDCHPEPDRQRTFRLYFSFAGGENSDIRPRDVESLNLYVFDRFGYYVTLYQDGSPALEREDYCMTFTLDGDQPYRFVAWGNAGPEYGFEVSAPEGNTHDQWAVTPDGSHTHQLIYGSLEAGPPTRSGNEEELTVELYQNSYTVSVTTEGITPSDEIYSLGITDSHRGFSFLNEPLYSAQGETFTYVCEKDAMMQPHTTGTVYALGENSAASLAFYNSTTGKRLYQDTLLAMIRKANSQGAAIDFTTTHRFDIHLEFDWQMEVSVRLNGWNVTNEYHELGRNARTI